MIKTKLTIIYSDSRRRDSTVAILIQEMLKKRGQLSFIASRRNFSKILRLTTPINIVVIGQINILFDLIYEDGVMRSKYRDINLYFYPAEGYATDREYRMMYPVKFTYGDLKKIYFWGRESLNWVKCNTDVNVGTLDNTGYPRIKMAATYDRLKKKPLQPKIGIVGRFNMLNDLHGTLTMKYIVLELATEADYKGVFLKRLRVEGEAILTIFKVIDFILNSTEYSISFRPHPNEDRDSYLKLKERFGNRFELSEEVDVADWIAGCSKILGLASSSYIDAGLMGVPIICVDKVANIVEETLIYEPAMKLIYEVAHMPENFDELKEFITTDLQSKQSAIFDGLIESNFIGDHPDPIRHVAETIKFVPNKFTTKVTKLTIDIADYLLMTKDRLKKNPTLDFDYSSVFHGRDEHFIQKYLGE